jgi:hypothetical protein
MSDYDAVASGNVFNFNNIIANTSSSLWGGGMFISGPTTDLVIKQANIANNVCTNGTGGGMYINGGTTIIQNSAIENNVANDVGGVYVLGSTTSVTFRPANGSISIKGNSGLTIGGILGYNGCTVRLEGTSDVFPAKKIEINGDNTLCEGVRFTDCTGYMQHVRVRNCGNSGVKLIGGTSGSPILLDNVVINGNGANASLGGGLWIESPDGQINVVNTAIFENTASNSGGGIFLDGDALSLVNIIFSVIVDNLGGTGIYALDSLSKINNSISWSNTGGDLFEAGSSALVLNNNLVNTNPLFQAQANYDYHIVDPSSPAIDTGSYPSGAPAEAAFDFDGDVRPSSVGAQVHIGADENDVTGGGGHVTVGPGGDYATIQGAINGEPSGTSILVFDGTYTENIDFIGKDMYIKAENDWLAIIDGNSAGTTVTINSGETSAAVLEGFVIQHGNGDPSGGGILIENNSNPVINNCQIIDNMAVNRGGGIYIDGSSPTILSCTIGGASGSGNYLTGAPYTRGSGISLVNSSAVIGLIGFQNTISYNHTVDFKADYGGGIYAGTGCNGVSINYNYIRNNIANYRGGGVYFAGCNPTFTNNEVSGNSTSFEHPLGQGTPAGGGGIFADNNASTLFVNNFIIQNSVTGSDGQLSSRVGGGGVYLLDSGPIVGSATPAPQANTISENTSDGHGAGILIFGNHVTAGAPTIQFNNIGEVGAFTGNIITSAGAVRGAGAGIMCISTSPTIQANVIKGNSTDGEGGGGIYITDNSAAHVLGNTIDSNVASTLPYSKGTGICSIASPSVIELNTITGGSKSVYGGGAYLSGPVIFTDNIVSNNTCHFYGGGVYAINCVEVSRNTVTGNLAFNLLPAGSGAGMLLETGVGICTGNMVWANTAAVVGGGIACRAFLGGRITNNTIIRNDGSNSGGGLSFIEGILSTQTVYIYNNIVHTNSALTPGQEDIWVDVTYEQNPFEIGNCCTTSIGSNTLPFSPPDMIYDDPLLQNFNGNDPAAGDFDLTNSSPCLQTGALVAISGISYDYHKEDRVQPAGSVDPDIGADEHDFLIVPSGNITIRPVLPNLQGYTSDYILDGDTATASSGTGKITGDTWYDLMTKHFGRESIRAEMELSGFLATALLDEMLPDGLEDLNEAVYGSFDYSYDYSGLSYMRFMGGGQKRDAVRAIRGVLEFVFGDFSSIQWTDGLTGLIRSSRAALGDFELDTPFHITVTPIFRPENGTDLVVKSNTYHRVIYDKIVLDLVIQPNPSATLMSHQAERVGKINTYGDLNKLVSRNSPWNNGSMRYTMDWDSSVKIMTDNGLRRFMIPCWFGACLAKKETVYRYTTLDMSPTSVGVRGQELNVLLDIPVAGEPIYKLDNTETRSSDTNEIMWPDDAGKDDSFYIGEVTDLNRALSSPIRCYVGRNPLEPGPGTYAQSGRLLSDWNGYSPIEVDIYITGDNLWGTGFSVGDKTSSLVNFSIGYLCSTTTADLVSDQVISTGFQPVYLSDDGVGVAHIYISDVDLRAIYDNIVLKAGGTSTLGDILLTVDYVTIKGPITRQARVFSQDALL